MNKEKQTIVIDISDMIRNFRIFRGNASIYVNSKQVLTAHILRVFIHVVASNNVRSNA